ncbi:MAG TPA: hypothetical protein VEU96_12850 [Bryobacteraceae bacterium]|nr:hypothetical protein [Bryobacteraceae bacterium]
MNNYPDVVTKIANDYLARVKSQLRLVPAQEQEEFLREIESHIFEAYQNTPGEDDVARILAVLRKFGEPAEVVADRLPAAMVRSGAKRYLPLHLLSGILIGLFGIPLGFGGVAVLAGVLLTLAAIVAVFYATMGVVFLTGALFLVMGLIRIYEPGVWDKLVTNGFIHFDRPVADFLDQLPPGGQGLLLIVIAAVFVACGLGMLWLGRYLVRGMRFLFNLAFDRVGKVARTVRTKVREGKQELGRTSEALFVKQ